MAPLELVLISILVAGAVAAPTARPLLSGYDGLASGSSFKPEQQQHTRDRLNHFVSSDYQCFGETDTDLSPQTWISFARLWHINGPTVSSRNGGDTYITHYIREAVVQVADESTVDARLVLALMMQEVPSIFPQLPWLLC